MQTATESRLAQRRKELKLSQEEVAERAGISQPWYSMIEAGRLPSVAVMRRISHVLQQSTTRLFPIDEDGEVNA